MKTALQTFTENSLEDILDRGGDYDWVLDQDRAKKCQYLVCCSSQGANRGSSFLVGKISGAEFTYASEDGKNKRYLVSISEYASINIPDSWPGNQNPIRYTSLEELNIDLASLKFEKVSKPISSSFTITQAKAGLAKHYGVSEDSIEITIKG
jgi:hypothetical protein